MRAASLLVVIVGSFLWPSFASADVLTQNANWDRWMCWRVDADVVCGDCQDDVPIYSRDVCSLELERWPANQVYERFTDIYGERLRKAEEKITGAVARINRADKKMLEFLAASPEPPRRQDLYEQIEQLRREIANLVETENAQQTQVRSLEEQMRLEPNPDLAAQLDLMRRRLAETVTARSAKETEVHDIVGDYIEENSSLFDPDIYAGLDRQRKRAVHEWGHYRRDADKAIEASTDAVRVWKMLEDWTFIYEHIDGNFPGTHRELLDLGNLLARWDRN